jgi:CRP-like cAMP-binding protein
MVFFSRLLRIERGEVPLAASLFLQSFLLGLPQLFTATAATALFLDAFSAKNLSFVLMSGAILVPLLGLAISSAIASIGAERTLRKVLILLLFGLGAITTALLFSGGAAAVRLILIVWVDLEYAFTEFSFSAHANRVLNIRQTKRLFALVGAGQVLAAVVGGALSPILLSILPVGGLLGISLAGLAGALVNFQRMARRFPLEEDDHVESAGTPLRSVVRDPLIRLLFVLVGFEFCVQGLSEALFYDGVQGSLSSAGSVASFLALFFGAAGACKLFLNLAASGPFLSRFGVRGGLLAPAASMALPLAAHLVMVSAGRSPQTAFLPLAAARFFQTISLSALYAPAYFTLYQPLVPVLRSSAQALADTVVGQVGAGAAGLSLFVILSVLGAGFPIVAAATLAVIVLWAVVALAAERRYRTEVTARARGSSRGAADQTAAATTGNRDLAQILMSIAREPKLGERAMRLEELFRSGFVVGRRTNAPDVRAYRLILETETALCGRYRAKGRTLAPGLLSSALERESAKAAERAILALALSYPRETIGALRYGLLFAESGERGFALELAESTLSDRDRRLLLPLFEDAEEGPASFTAADPLFLRELADEATEGCLDWLRLVALRELSRSAGSAALRSGEIEYLELEAPVVERARSLAGAPLFATVPHEDLAALGRTIRERSVSAGERIISRGEEGSELYIVDSGRVSVSIGDTVLAEMGPGEVFGELSALSPEPRSADVNAAADTRLLVVEGASLRTFIGQRWRTAFEILKVLDRRVIDTLNLRFPIGEASSPRTASVGRRPAARRFTAREESIMTEHIPLLLRLPDDALSDVKEHALLRLLDAGERACSAGEPGTGFFFILSGRIMLCRGERGIIEIGEGGVFGNTECVLSVDRPFDAAATERTELLELPRRILSDLVWDGSSFLEGLILDSADRLRRVTSAPKGGLPVPWLG